MSARYEWRPEAAEILKAWAAAQPSERPNPLLTKPAKKACATCGDKPPAGFICKTCGKEEGA